MKQTDQPRALGMTLQEAETAQAKCWTKYKTDKNNAAELRQQCETRVNEKRAIKYKTSVKTQEKITKHAFHSKHNFTRIRKVMDKKLRTALTSVEYTDEWNVDHKCTTKEEIDQACMSEGYQRYAHTHGTPFLTTPLLEDFGFLGNQEKTDEILSGTYVCPEDLDEFTQKFMDELGRPEQANLHGQISGYMTTEEHIQEWKKMRIGTVASTFGRSFSEIIAGTEDITIAEVDAAMVSIATLSRYRPRRWSEAIDIMIPKKADSIHVKKLRIIILFHALFNMVNKKVAREAIQNATKMNAIPSEITAEKGDLESQFFNLYRISVQ
jgi:hypothetical protein